jgi:hypothetical protein
VVIGSVAEGKARAESDLDLLLVLRHGAPCRSDYAWWDRAIAPLLDERQQRFPIQPLFIARTSLATTEPHLRRAIDSALVLWDPEGMLDDQPRPGA